MLGKNVALCERFSLRVTERIRAHNIITTSSGVRIEQSQEVLLPPIMHESILFTKTS